VREERPVQAKLEWLPPKHTYSAPLTRYILWYKPIELGTFERIEIVPTSTSFVVGNLRM